MGRAFSFRCPDCGYEATVSGGDAAGMLGATTVSCSGCRELYDVLFWSPEEPEQGQEPRCPEQTSP